jgi:hypothetical protein
VSQRFRVATLHMQLPLTATMTMLLVLGSRTHVIHPTPNVERGWLANADFQCASVATEIAEFNSRCRYNNAEAIHSRHYVTAVCTSPYHNRSEFVLTTPRLHAVDNASGSKTRLRGFAVKPVWNIICCYVLCSDMHCEEITLTRNTNSAVENNGSIGPSRRCELESFRYTPTAFAFAEFFGGGLEYLPFWRPPFSLIRLFEEEDE